VFVLAVDIISKAIVVAKMPATRPSAAGRFLTITLTRNGGAAFSIGTSMTICHRHRGRRNRLHPAHRAQPAQHRLAIALGLLLGGAMATWATGSSAPPACCARGGRLDRVAALAGLQPGRLAIVCAAFCRLLALRASASTAPVKSLCRPPGR